jgi:ATP-dependent DNA helicase RecQ
VKDDELHQVAQALIVHEHPVRPRELLEELPLSDTKLATAIQHLEEAGFAQVLDDGSIAAKRDTDLIEAVERAGEAEEHRQAFDRSRVEMMRAYAETDGCRRAFVLGYFGEDYEPPCENCDVCERRGEDVARTEEDGRFAAGDRVRHAEWGGGSVGQVEDGQITVVFDTVGYKTLGVDIVLERGLLEAE